MAKTMSELREDLVNRANRDEGFRARLIEDPKAAVREELGVSVPDGFEIRVHKEDEGIAHLVLPPTGTLEEDDLAEAAGGGYWTRRSQWSNEMVYVRTENDYNP